MVNDRKIKEQWAIYRDPNGITQSCAQCGETVNVEFTDLDYVECAYCGDQFHPCDENELFSFEGDKVCNECIIQEVTKFEN